MSGTEFCTVLGAVAAISQLVVYTNRLRVWAHDLPASSTGLLQQSRALFSLAQTVKEQYGGKQQGLDDAVVDAFLVDCERLQKLAHELRLQPKASNSVLRRLQMRRFYSWKIRQPELNSIIGRINGHVQVISLWLQLKTSAKSTSAELVGALAGGMNPTDPYHLTHALSKSAMVATATGLNNLPHFRSRFVGRSGLLETLAKKLLQPDHQPRAAIVGLTGTGKSRLARECGVRMQLLRPETSVFWIDGSSEDLFEQSMLEIATLAQIHGSVIPDNPSAGDVKRYLESPECHSLLIIDGFNEASTLFGHRRLLHLIPENKTCRILVTTQDSRLAHEWITPDSVYRLGALEAEEAKQLFLEHAYGVTPTPSDLSAICAQLHHLPAAIRFTASYISQMRMPISAYLDNLQDQQWNNLQLTAFPAAASHSPARNAPETAFQMSYNKIQAQDPLAAKILNFMATLHHSYVPQHLLELAFAEVGLTNACSLLHGFELVDRCQSAYNSREGSTGELLYLQYSVHVFLRNQLRSSGNSKDFAAQALEALLQAIPDHVLDGQSIKWATPYIPHAAEVLEQFRTQYKVNPEHLISCGKLASKLSALIKTQGSYERASEFARLAVDLADSSFGPNAKETLAAKAGLAECIELSGDLSIAETVWREVLGARETVLGKDDAETIATMNNLAILLNSQGRFVEAEQLYQKALMLDKASQRDQTAPANATRMNLAINLQEQNKLSDAEVMYREVLQWYDTNLGQLHPSTLSAKNNLATTLQLQGRWEEAWELYQEALIGRSKVLGRAHPDTVNSLLNIGNLLRSRGYLADAEATVRQAVELHTDRLDSRHPYTITAIRVLAHVLHSAGKLQEAKNISEEGYRNSRRTFGPDHETTIALKTQADQLRSWLREREVD